MLLFGGFLVIWHVVFAAFGFYQSKRLTSCWSESSKILQATAVGSAGIYLLSVSLEISMVQGLFLPVFFASMAAITVACRLVLRWVLGAVRRRGRNLRHVLIVGTNSRAIAFARKLEVTPELGFRLIGFVDSREWDMAGEFERSGYQLLGDMRELPELLRRQVVDEVMVFLPLKSFYELNSRIVKQCEEQGIRVTLPSSLFELKNARVLAEAVDDEEPAFTMATGAIEGAPAAAKRAIDLVVAAALLVALAPLFLAVALLVKATSPGPVFFTQERIGLSKRRFRMLKFRTMVVDAERRQRELEHLNEANGPVFKIRKDPRITSVGAVLRNTSIDELPQLLNVLKGDLSLVGPRPLPVRDYEGFERDWHRRRFSVRPGITCLWQIGGRSDVSFERWMELDMQYIDTWSLWLDLKILCKTIPAVLRGAGAA
ncbi:MAG: hypothetical protein A2V77_17250 [Anaeromyxobacter sp. RBG_16_69_14]|nr:MAG: hypothetical protein A2V77_17250 [Anaeromyxobacter sp. RBG_16_69_14]